MMLNWKNLIKFVYVDLSQEFGLGGNCDVHYYDSHDSSKMFRVEPWSSVSSGVVEGQSN